MFLMASLLYNTEKNEHSSRDMLTHSDIDHGPHMPYGYNTNEQKLWVTGLLLYRRARSKPDLVIQPFVEPFV